jgi:hypothetical protein
MKTMRGWMLAVFLAAFVLSIIARVIENDRRAAVQNRQQQARGLAGYAAKSLERSTAFEARARSEKDGARAAVYRKQALFYRNLADASINSLERLTRPD